MEAESCPPRAAWRERTSPTTAPSRDVGRRPADDFALEVPRLPSAAQPGHLRVNVCVDRPAVETGEVTPSAMAIQQSTLQHAGSAGAAVARVCVHGARQIRDVTRTSDAPHNHDNHGIAARGTLTQHPMPAEGHLRSTGVPSCAPTPLMYQTRPAHHKTSHRLPARTMCTYFECKRRYSKPVTLRASACRRRGAELHRPASRSRRSPQ